jgi:hypothetical protein
MSRQSEWQEYRRAREECTSCGKAVAEINPHTERTFATCRVCRAKQCAQKRRKYAETYAHTPKGQCRKCAGVTTVGRKYCETCLAHQQARRELRALKHLCIMCGNKRYPSSSRCLACLEKSREKAKNLYDQRRRAARGGRGAVPLPDVPCVVEARRA